MQHLPARLSRGRPGFPNYLLMRQRYQAWPGKPSPMLHLPSRTRRNMTRVSVTQRRLLLIVQRLPGRLLSRRGQEHSHAPVIAIPITFIPLVLKGEISCNLLFRALVVMARVAPAASLNSTTAQKRRANEVVRLLSCPGHAQAIPTTSVIRFSRTLSIRVRCRTIRRTS